MSGYLNSDGLYIKLGVTEATSQVAGYPQGGEFKTHGETRVQSQILDLAKLPAFGTTGILNDVEFFGKGWVPEVITVETLVAATGATATLSIGLRQNSDRVTDISTTALINAITVASIAAVGTRLTITAGSTGAGANIGVATTFDALWTATVGTANFTAGKVRVSVQYRPTVAL